MKTVSGRRARYIGTIFGLFLLGRLHQDSRTSKATARGGCTHSYRLRRADGHLDCVAPFVIPVILDPGGLYAGILTGNALLLNLRQRPHRLRLLHGLSCWCAIPDELATTENHPSWTHMYQMMMLCPDRVRARVRLLAAGLPLPDSVAACGPGSGPRELLCPQGRLRARGYQRNGSC